MAAVLFSFILADGAYSYSPEESQKAIANGATDVYNPSKIGYAGRFISKISRNQQGLQGRSIKNSKKIRIRF